MFLIITLLLLLAIKCKHDLSLRLKYSLAVCLCPSDDTIFGGRPPSSPSKI